MAKSKKVSEVSADQDQPTNQNVSIDAVANAFIKAIERTKPAEKKTAANRVANTPWTPKDGSPKVKLKRKMYHHGIIVDPDFHTNEELDLMNKLKPGRFLDNWVLVERRRDRGVNITYPVKTAAQRLKLSSTFGISGPKGLCVLLQKCIDEAANPQPDSRFDDED